MDFSNFSCHSLGLVNMKQINLPAFLDHLNIPISKHVIHVTFNLMDFSNFSCQSLGLVNMKQINLPAIFPSPSVSKVRRCTWSFKLGDKKPWCLNQLETGPVTQKNNWCCLHSLTTFNNKFRHAYKINFCQCEKQRTCTVFFSMQTDLKGLSFRKRHSYGKSNESESNQKARQKIAWGHIVRKPCP